MSDRIAVMNEGRIEQLGTPRDIYTRPTSVFASDFIGDTNLIRGTVVATDGRRVDLVTEAGATVSGEASEAIAPGTAATLSVRPGSVRVIAHDRRARTGRGCARHGRGASGS